LRSLARRPPNWIESVLQLGDLYVGLDGRELGRVDRQGL
jgi:hypothetical protein